MALAVVGTLVVLSRAPDENAVLASTAENLPAVIELEPVVLTADVQEPAMVEPYELFASASSEPIPTHEKPWIILRTESTNLQPTTPRMKIGGGELIPVSFEY